VDVNALGVDFLAISGHKIGAPKGVGALYVRKGRELMPQLLGGGHEGGLRSGTENVPGIVGLARAMELAVEELDTVPPEMRRLRGILKHRLVSDIPHLTVNSDCIECLPHTLSVCIKGVFGTDLVEALDREGVAVSSGSACHVGERKVSHVLRAMGVAEEEAAGSLRISLGWDTTEQDVLFAASKIRDLVTCLREKRGPETAP
jgi:cysteine desulfurase